VVRGSIKQPIQADPRNITPVETTEIAVWDLWVISTYMEIKHRVANSVKAVLGKSLNPKDIWDTGLRTYVCNRTLTSALDGRTPYEMVYDVMPDLADWHAFGVPQLG